MLHVITVTTAGASVYKRACSLGVRDDTYRGLMAVIAYSRDLLGY